jgi:hypothetical protein
MKLKHFLDSKDRNGWLQYGTLHVYVRKSRRRIEGESLQPCLDIATAECKTPGQGGFSNFLAHAIALCPFEYIYIENVLEERFQQFFLKHGFIRDQHHPSDYCFYKKVK